MSEVAWLVTYSVEGFDDQVRSYPSEDEARRQARDIEGYAGVSNVQVVPDRPTLMQHLLRD